MVQGFGMEGVKERRGSRETIRKSDEGRGMVFGGCAGAREGESRRMKVHAVQLDCVWEDPEANREKVEGLLSQLKCGGGDLVVLPEMFLTGFSVNTAVTAQETGGAHEDLLRRWAARLGCAVLGGVASRNDQGLFNEAVAYAPTGEVLVRYAKRQPFVLGGEGAVHEKGRQAKVFDWGGFRVGPLVCYDLRFPELAREAAGLGAEMLVCIASWPIARVEHWLTLLRARAIENQAFVAGVNRCGRDPNFTYPGRTVVVDPHGVIVADASDREQVLTVSCDPEVARAWRAAFPALRDAGLLQG
jgi:omega-amidase